MAARTGSALGLAGAGLAALLTLGVGGVAMAESAAERAVEAAKQYAGTEITIVWEAGLQSLDPLNFSGPKWKELTGIDVKVIEVPTAEMFTKILQEHRAGTGAYDALNVIPSWMPDLARAGALEPLDAYVDKYGYRDELQKIAPVFRDNQMKVGDTIYGFPDDGDVFLLYYRKDILEENSLQPPKTWAEFDKIGQMLTDKYAPKMYGAAFFRDPPYAQLMFQERFRVEGGKFFDPDTMKATINSDIGVKVFTDMRAENKFMPPGVETWGFVENLAAFLAGQTAMTISWPPYGRWAAGYGTDEEALSWVPKSTIAGKVGYALPPGGHPELALGFSLAVASDSKHKEAAYLFIQWLNSEDISLAARAAALRAARSVPQQPLRERRVQVALAGGAAVSRSAAPGRAHRPARPVAAADRPLRGGASPGPLAPVGRRRPEDDPRRRGRAMGRHHPAGRGRQAEGGLSRLGEQAQRLSEVRLTWPGGERVPPGPG